MQRTKGILSLVFLLLSLVGGLFLVLNNQDSRKKATNETLNTKCQWCGISCIVVGKDMKCPIVAGLAGKQCVTNGSGNCEVKDEAVPSKVVLPKTTGEAVKNKVGAGLMCGGIEGVLCEDGLVCDLGEGVGKPDASGMCKEGAISPTGKKLWWLDNNTKVCQEKEFVGMYVYEGLRTFDTKEQCVSAMNNKVTTIAPLPVVTQSFTALPVTPNIPVASQQTVKLDFKIAFEGLNNNTKCANGWRVDVELKGDKGLSKKFEQVVLIPERSFSVLPIYRGQVEVEGYTGEKLMVYISGPRHMRMAYGIDLQGGEFDGIIGDIVLNTVGRIFDFSGYPLLGGDVTGTGGKRDGLVTKADVTMVSASARKREITDGTKELVSDLNGDCVVNSLDVMMAMKNVGK